MTDHPGSADGRLSKSFLDLSELLNALEDTEGPGADSDLEAGPTKPLSDAETEYQDSIGDEITSAEVIDLLDPPEEHERFFDLKMVWRGQTFDVCVGSNDRVFDFRQKIYSLTQVKPESQKLIGLVKGKLPAKDDLQRFGSLGLSHSRVKFTMVGTPEEESFEYVEPSEPTYQEALNIVQDRLTKRRGGKSAAEDVRNLRKLAESIEKYPITVINEPRPNKKLLVLDLDYTLVDSAALFNSRLPPALCARPGLHDFLKVAYERFDIAIWSHSHWRHLHSKLVALCILGLERNHKICFVIDERPMFTVVTKSTPASMHQVKPLAYIWARFPQWSPENVHKQTIHVDDLSRNFEMNPAQGLKIRPFNNAGTPEGERDRHLALLGIYAYTMLVFWAEIIPIGRQSRNHMSRLCRGEWKTISAGDAADEIHQRLLQPA